MTKLPAAYSLAWRPQGPRPNTNGQSEVHPDKQVVGAVNALVLHPAEAGIAYAGAVNGGIWHTANLMTAQPHWQHLADTALSLSIGALAFDPADSSHQTLIAGIGRYSSYYTLGGALIGLLRTTDGGASWTVIDGGDVWENLNVRAVVARGDTIVVAANPPDGFGNGGVFRTTDLGRNWTQVSGSGTGLPAATIFDMVEDAGDRARLFAAGPTGIYRSTDTGVRWTRINDTVFDGVLGEMTGNIILSVGRSDNVYAAVANFFPEFVNGQWQYPCRLAGLFRSGNAGTNWTALDLPATVEGGGVLFGLHPGGQGYIHFSLAADPTDAQIVYVGGDRQPGFDEGGAPVPRWPNSLGALDYTGRLFRVDASKPTQTQVAPLTHSGTASNTAPHGDSRCMAVAANGDLIEADDGGVYRRTVPHDTEGDWHSANGDLQTTEFHSADWDANSSTLIGGAQDTGTPQQAGQADTTWFSVSTGDGGAVAVDDVSTPGMSTRYSSYQYLFGFRRETYDVTSTLQSQVPVPLQVGPGLPQVAGQFLTPIALNQATPTRLVIGAANGVYESDDQGDTVTAISPGLVANEGRSGSFGGALAYGTTGNPDVLYVGVGPSVFIRTAAHPDMLQMSANYPGTGNVVAIAIPSTATRTAFAIDVMHVYLTTDDGGKWTDITGNLFESGLRTLCAVAFCADLEGGSVLVGTDAGVLAARGPGYSAWNDLGSGLPRTSITQLRYNASNRTLLAATLGRGMWTLMLSDEAVA